MTIMRVGNCPAVEPKPWTIGDTMLLDDGHDWTVQAVTTNFAALTRPVSDRDRTEAAEEYEHPEADCDYTGGRDDEYCDHVSHYSDPPDLGDGPYYTVVDWRNGVRGPCNLIGQSWGDGTYSPAECAAMLAEFEAGELEVSHRNRVAL